jgi:hypothetical protein
LADILIPHVPDDIIAAIDRNANRLGLSRSDFLHRALDRERSAQSGEVSTADLASFAAIFTDLDDPEVMRGAW